MQAVLCEAPGQLKLVSLPRPQIQAHQLLIRVTACGICRTDLHVLDGELSQTRYPVIPGHQIVGVIEELGEHVTDFSPGQRVGVPWLGGSCGHCEYCQHQRENLCDQAVFTGCQINGGFAQYCLADSRFSFLIPQDYPDTQAAPLLCGGLIGYRALSKTGSSSKLGLYGFGSAGHLVIQMARHQNRQIFVFTKPQDQAAQSFARNLGATWAGGSDETPPDKLDAAILFAPDGALVPKALQDVKKGGKVVCAGIHMSDIPSFPYTYLWGEREICSIANLTRQDGENFLALAPKIPIKTTVHTYPLEKTPQALEDLRQGRFEGSAVITL